MPTFVNIRLWKSSLKKSEQYKSLQRNCVLREFESRQKQARKLEKQVSSIVVDLEKHLSSVDYINVKKLFHDSAQRVHTKVMSIHQKKLEKLNRGPIGQNYEEMKSKLIHNISSYTLSPAEERLLCRGWDFCIENKISNFLELETDIELNAMKIESHCHSSVFRSICRHIHNASQQLMRTSKHKKIRNLSDEELSALKSLKSNNNIVICKADKGNCIVILDKESYMSKAEEILKGKQFEMLKDDKFHRKREEELNRYVYSLLKEGVIDRKLRFQLQSTCSSLSVFYGLPKVHKTGYPIRPIISTIGSYQYQLSKYLARAIRDARPQANSYIKDSFEFVKKIKDTILEKEKVYIMCSFDVESLYTNVPVEEAIEITLDFIYKPKKVIDVPFNREQLNTLLNLSIRDAPFRFQNKIYKQVDGVAMGNPLAPIIADLWMQKMEEKLNRFSTNKPMIWLRYVDDVFCLFTISKTKIEAFHSRINKWHKNLNFTLEFEENNSIAFLDVLVTREENQLITSLYRKPTHTGLYMLWDSCQNRRYKLGLIRTLVIRIYRICSTETATKKEINTLRSTLADNGYPLHIIRRGIKEGEILIKRMSHTEKNNTSNEKRKKVIFFTIQYYGQESIIFAARVKKICQKLLPHLVIQFCFRKHMSLKSIFLPKLKGKDENKKNKNLVYSIPCMDCDKVYIGETSRMKDTRMDEHKAKVKLLSSDSKIVEHILEHNHKFDFSNASTLALETDWRKRVIKESIMTYRTLGRSINDTKHTIRIVG
jgi:sugar-specific transcriptional regulator TrmB